MALCSQVFSHTFHFSSGTHNKLWLDFVKKDSSIYAEPGCKSRLQGLSEAKNLEEMRQNY